MTKKSKKFFLAPAISILRIQRDKEAIAEFKKQVCEILGWGLPTWYRVQSVGIVDIGLPQYEAINEVLKKYGITPEQGWGIKDV